MSKTTKLVTELQEFIADQAVQDARLSLGERRYQADLVKDVLSQEVSNAKLLKQLVGAYCGQVAQLRR